MFTRVVQIHVHLTGIGVGELAALEIDDHEATELAMEEQQIDPIPFVSDAKPTLSANESKIAAQLQKKSLEMQNERFFNLGLGIFVFESEELEHVRVFDFFFRRNRVFRLCRSALAEHFCFVSRQRGPLVEERIDLAIELPNAPAAAQRFGLVKFSRRFAGYGKKPDVSRPRQREMRREIANSQLAGRCLTFLPPQFY